ncbi:MAG: hypothetical protein IKE34_13155 [Paenibacillus sp.]|nr:hypothetical protein [Paenibacillus sp.]
MRPRSNPQKAWDEQLRELMQHESEQMKLDARIKEQIVEQAKPSLWERRIKIRIPVVIAISCVYVLAIVLPLWMPQQEAQLRAGHDERILSYEQGVLYVIDGSYIVRQDLFWREADETR